MNTAGLTQNPPLAHRRAALRWVKRWLRAAISAPGGPDPSTQPDNRKDQGTVRRVSKTGVDLIKSFEGLRLNAYDDGTGVLTIGYGSTNGVQWGDAITEDEADRLLKEDLDRFERCVETAVEAPLTQNQFDALVSLAFNIGCGAFRRSTLLRRLNRGGYLAAANQFPRWSRAGGRVLQGLVRRRAAERALFLGELAPEEAASPADCRGATLRPGPVPTPCVAVLQKALNRWCGDCLAVDGAFGPKTAHWVGLYQETYQLVPDKVVGPKTWKALETYL